MSRSLWNTVAKLWSKATDAAGHYHGADGILPPDHKPEPTEQERVVLRRRDSRTRLRDMEGVLAKQWDDAVQNPEATMGEKREIAHAYGAVVSALHTHYE